MAARLTKRQAEGAKDAIKTGMLIKRLQDHVLDKEEMTQTQLRAAEILLGKTLPNLKATEHTGEGGGPIQFKPFQFVDAEDSTASE